VSESDPTTLTDRFGRRIDYLRLSVIDRCNLRCFYCRPERDQRSARVERLAPDGFIRVAAAFARLGVSRVRLTGGEPMLRRDLESIVEGVAALRGIKDLSLSTNGYLLERRAHRLRRAGLHRVNLSLDSLDPARFRAITRLGRLERVLAGIDAALAAGLAPVKLNMVVLRGVNDDEIPALLEFAAARRLELRFIETMPLGTSGREAMSRHVPAREILERVRVHAGQDLVPVASSAGAGPARCYRLGASGATVGVIAAVSRHFCATCNRVRLSATGDLLLCLGREHRVPLRSLIESGVGDEVMEAAIRDAIRRKPWSHDFLNGGGSAVDMSGVGG
jgi:cyclic pyranopterin phosphate synthase